jgi:LysR family transcriptional regulator for metE and metH
MARSVLEIRHLRTLLALEAHGGLTRAAQALCLTQSAVSHQLKMLEGFYGENLLYKQGGVLRFTGLGQRLLALAHAVLQEVDAAELDVQKMMDGAGGPLRVAVECHTCFDWLMPAMDEHRLRWPDVELDIVSGFHADPVALLHQAQAELAVVSEPCEEAGVVCFSLFEYEMVGVVPVDSPLAQRAYLKPADFKDQTLISYPVPDDMLDIIRLFLAPAKVQVKRRNSELTVALLQLVASKRGLSALPAWAVAPYVQRGYVAQVRLGKQGLKARLFAAVPTALAGKAYVEDFVEVMRHVGAKVIALTP